MKVIAGVFTLLSILTMYVDVENGNYGMGALMAACAVINFMSFLRRMDVPNEKP